MLTAIVTGAACLFIPYYAIVIADRNSVDDLYSVGKIVIIVVVLVVSPPLNTAPCVWRFCCLIVRHAELADCNPVLSFAHTVIFLSPVQHCSVPIVSRCRRLHFPLDVSVPIPHSEAEHSFVKP